MGAQQHRCQLHWLQWVLCWGSRRLSTACEGGFGTSGTSDLLGCLSAFQDWCSGVGKQSFHTAHSQQCQASPSHRDGHTWGIGWKPSFGQNELLFPYIFPPTLLVHPTEL